MELDDFHKEILGICADDDTGLWVIIRHASRDYSFPDPVPGSVRHKTLKVIRELLEADLIEAGNFQWMIKPPPELSGYEKVKFIQEHQDAIIFRPLNLEVDETIRFIEEKWDALGRSPSGGDVCWFRATPKGEQLAQELGLEQ